MRVGRALHSLVDVIEPQICGEKVFVGLSLIARNMIAAFPTSIAPTACVILEPVLYWQTTRERSQRDIQTVLVLRKYCARYTEPTCNRRVKLKVDGIHEDSVRDERSMPAVTMDGTPPCHADDIRHRIRIT